MEKVVVKTLDDTTGEEGASTIEFGLDGDLYEIDLTEVNAQRLRDKLAPFVAVSRRLAKGTAKATQLKTAPKRPAIDREQLQAMREWARKHDLRVSPRGRIPEIVKLAYNEDNPEIAREKQANGNAVATPVG